MAWEAMRSSRLLFHFDVFFEKDGLFQNALLNAYLNIIIHSERLK